MPELLTRESKVCRCHEAVRDEAPPALDAAPLPWEKAARPLRVLEVVNDFPPTVGGSETHNTSEVDFLCRRGHSVCVLAARDRRALLAQPHDDDTRRLLDRDRWAWSEAHRVPVYEANDAGRRSLLKLAWQYHRLSRTHGPFDVVIVHRAHLLPAFARARRLVLTLHYLEVACPQTVVAPLCRLGSNGHCDCYRERSLWRNLKWAARRRLSIRLMDAVVTKYSHIAEKLRWAGVPASKVHCVPNWIDASRYGGRRRTWPTMPAGLPDRAAPGTFCFVSLGRLIPEHGGRLAFEAFSRIAPRHPAARLMVVGDGPDMAWFRQRVAEAGLTDRVVLTGRVEHADVPAVLSWADCGVAASNVDNYSWRLLEMMAAGLPILATDRGPMHEVLDDGRAGWVCDVRPEALADVMEKMVWNAADAPRLGASARAKIVAEYSPNNLLQYESILAGGAA